MDGLPHGVVWVDGGGVVFLELGRVNQKLKIRNSGPRTLLLSRRAGSMRWSG